MSCYRCKHYDVYINTKKDSKLKETCGCNCPTFGIIKTKKLECIRFEDVK